MAPDDDDEDDDDMDYLCFHTNLLATICLELVTNQFLIK